jgi:hypothetical protein
LDQDLRAEKVCVSGEIWRETQKMPFAAQPHLLWELWYREIA